MSDPMRIRAQAAGDKVTVRVLVSHDMETGLRKTADGKTVPALFIQSISATHNGKTVMNAQWGTAVSKIRSSNLRSQVEKWATKFL